MKLLVDVTAQFEVEVLDYDAETEHLEIYISKTPKYEDIENAITNAVLVECRKRKEVYSEHADESENHEEYRGGCH